MTAIVDFLVSLRPPGQVPAGTIAVEENAPMSE
jgi:hypothetical protein